MGQFVATGQQELCPIPEAIKRQKGFYWEIFLLLIFVDFGPHLMLLRPYSDLWAQGLLQGTIWSIQGSSLGYSHAKQTP